MRRRSLKNAARQPLVDDFRESLFNELGGYCDWCGIGDRLDPHEIARAGSKQGAIMERCAVLLLCRDCHEAVHRHADDRAIGLAVLYLSRPSDFDYERFVALTGRRFPELRAVMRWTRRLSMSRKEF